MVAILVLVGAANTRITHGRRKALTERKGGVRTGLSAWKIRRQQHWCQAPESIALIFQYSYVQACRLCPCTLAKHGLNDQQDGTVHATTSEKSVIQENEIKKGVEGNKAASTRSAWLQKIASRSLLTSSP